MAEPHRPPIGENGSAGGSDFAIVGLGASAGGLQALITFFEQVPADCSMAFVVILHLSPSHPSEAAAILQRAARLPVTEVTDDTAVQPGHVYVIAPNRQLAMADGVLTVTTTATTRKRGAHTTINGFFRAMANACKERCFGVLLSGTGADGMPGMARHPRHSACAHRPRFLALQARHRAAPPGTPAAGAHRVGLARVSRRDQGGPRRERSAAQGLADRRDAVFPRPRNLRGDRARCHTRAVR